MNVADVMTRNLITVTSGMPVADAARLMLEHRVSGLPVVDDRGGLIGIITEADLLRRAETGTDQRLSWWRSVVLGSERLAEQYVRSHARKVGEVMQRDLVTIRPAASLAEAVAMMESRSVKRLPVLDGTTLVGIVSRADLLRALERLLLSEEVSETAASTDAAIRRKILLDIGRQRWVPAALIDVKVREGTVELEGLIFSEGQRHALRVLAENTAHVRAVVDKLVWIEPYSGVVLQLPAEEQQPAAAQGLKRAEKH